MHGCYQKWPCRCSMFATMSAHQVRSLQAYMLLCLLLFSLSGQMLHCKRTEDAKQLACIRETA